MEEVRDVSPTTAGTISQRRWLSVSATTAIMFVALSLAVAGGTTNGLDRAVHRWLHDSGVGHGGWLMSMQAATHLGDIGTVVTVEIAAAVTCVVTQRLRTATLIATTAGLVWALRIGVRDIIDRPRPIDAFWTADGAAFPSGHATNAATAATLVLIAVWPWLRTWTGRIAAIGVAAAWAAVVGLSRVAGGVHWPTDVLGGWLLSMTVVTAALAALVGSAARAGDAR